MISRLKGRWRHFAPRRRHQPHERNDFCVDDCILPSGMGSKDIYDLAMKRVKQSLQRRPEVKNLDKRIDQFRSQAHKTNVANDWLVTLFAQAPRSVLAQRNIDKDPHGYQNAQARVMELIDFNDAFVSAVLAMNDEERRLFEIEAKRGCDYVCRLVNVPEFSDDQWRAIYKGLSREIAVYLAAQRSGFYAYMTSRAQDAMGIDMQIKDPEGKGYINLDVKSPSAFRRRLERLEDEGRLTSKQVLQADERSYALVENGHGKQKAQVILLCILPDKLGEVENFQFVDESPIRDMLGDLVHRYGLRDNRYGEYGSKAV